MSKTKTKKPASISKTMKKALLDELYALVLLVREDAMAENHDFMEKMKHMAAIRTGSDAFCGRDAGKRKKNAEFKKWAARAGVEWSVAQHCEQIYDRMRKITNTGHRSRIRPGAYERLAKARVPDKVRERTWKWMVSASRLPTATPITAGTVHVRLWEFNGRPKKGMPSQVFNEFRVRSELLSVHITALEIGMTTKKAVEDLEEVVAALKAGSLKLSKCQKRS